MKRFIFISVLAWGLIHCTYAKKIEGTIVYDNVEVAVVFNIPVGLFKTVPNFEILQRRIIYFDKQGHRIVLKPDHAREVRFEYRGQKVRMLSRCDSTRIMNVTGKGRYVFLKLEIEGKLSLFKYFYTEHSGAPYDPEGGSTGTTYPAERFILQKENDALKEIRGLSFRKDMMSYFDDCQELVERIDDKIMRKKDLVAIVQYFNSHCADPE